MQAAALIAHTIGVLSRADLERQSSVLHALRLPLRWPMALDDVLAGLTKDKKRAGAKQRWILATRVGAGVIRDDVPWDVARAAVASITQG
jgi:3-dehydroquinate synthetase